MPATLSPFSEYSRPRLAALAARLAALPADLWAEAGPVAGHLGASAAGELRVEFAPAELGLFAADAPRVAEALGCVARPGVLAALADAEDADLLSAWELLESLQRAAALVAPISGLAAEAAAIADRLAAEMARMPGARESVSEEVLAAGLRTLIAEWSAAAAALPPGEARLRFLALLQRHLLAACPAPANFWEILLLKLELALASPAESPALAALLAPVFRVAWSSLPLQPALHAFWRQHAGVPAAERAGAEQLAVLAAIARVGGQPAKSLRAAFTPSLVATVDLAAVCAPSARWRAALAQELELAAYQPLFQAADHWGRLADAVRAIPAEIEARRPALRKIADDLAQGMQGRDISDQFASLGAELLARGLWAGALTPNPTEARELFLPAVVRELGLDPALGCWRKLSRLSSALQQMAAGQPGALPWAAVPGLLRSLEARATECKALPLRWASSLAPADFAGLPRAGDHERCARDARLLLSRLAVDLRLHGAAGEAELARWQATQVLPHLRHIPDEAYRERWDVLAEAAFSPAPDHAALNAAARRVGQRLPRLTAAWKLDRHAESIARDIADEVLKTLPDYAEKIGAEGRQSCVRDNALTLRQISTLLLADVASPHEVLAEWWNSAVGSYLATRPARLFETNLAAIYHALQRHLDPAEVPAAFSPIQAVYRETLGVECLEALAGPPTPLVGPLGRRLAADSPVPADIPPAPLARAVETALAAGGLVAAAQTAETIAQALLVHHRERWLSGDVDTAVARVLPLINIPAIQPLRAASAAAVLAAVADPAVAADADSVLLGESADSLALALGQSGLAHALVNHADEIATAYGEAMVAHAPALFAPLAPAEALARCRRDQTILLRNLGERLGRTAPGLFWIDATRWFLELLAPFVDYPAHVWALSFRTVAKHLGPRLSPPGRVFLARWVSQAEHLAPGWAAAHALARRVFHPADYSFSARADEDRLRRDLLAAALVARFAPREGPWSGAALHERFLLSWPASLRSAEELTALVADIRRVAGPLLPPGVDGWLEKTPALAAALARADGPSAAHRHAAATGLPAAREASRALDLVLDRRPAALAVWKAHRASPPTAPARSLAQAALRAHLLHPLGEEAPRALAATFPAASRARAGLVAAATGATAEPVDWTRLAEGLLPHAESANTLRSHFSGLALEWPALQAALALDATADKQAEEFLGRLETGREGAYSTGAPRCDHANNLRAFAYVFRQAAAATWLASAEPPRMFFGAAADNHRLLPVAVAANAHARTHAALRARLPAGSALAGDVVFGIEAPFFPPDGPLWRALALHAGARSPDYVVAAFPAIRPLAEAAAAYARPDDAERRAALADRACHWLEALVCGLEESGDLDAAWELLLRRLAPDVAQLPPAELLAVFHGLTRDPSPHLALGPGIFWRTVFLATLDVVRQACLGAQLLRDAATLARDYAAEAVRDETARAKCARDQEHALATLGHLLATQAPARAWLNFSAHVVELTLPHLGHDALDLAAAWCRHEAALSHRLAPALRPAAWLWLGALQRMARNLPAVRPFAANALAPLADKLAATHGEPTAHWRRFLAALAAAAATPDEGPMPGAALVEKLLLATPLGHALPPAAWPDLADTVSAGLENALPGRVPSSLKRRIQTLETAARRLDALAAGRGSRVVRALAAQAAAPLARPLWRASLLARARPDERLVESDAADTLAADALGLPLEADAAMLERLAAVRAVLGLGRRLPLAAPRGGGLLARLGLGKKPFDWLQSAGLRAEGSHVLEVLALHAVTAHADPAHLWYWACPQTLAAVDPAKEAGTREFYQALADSAAQALGDSHPGALALRRFANDLAARLAGLKLVLPPAAVPGPVPLRLLGLRQPEDAPAYARLAPFAGDSAAFAEGVRARGLPLTDDQTELVARAHEEMRRATA